MPTLLSFKLISLNSSIALFSWLNALTILIPDMVSSICPFNFPSSSCWDLNKTLVFLAIVRVSKNTRGTVITLAKVKIGLSSSIITTEPASIIAPDISCTIDWDTVLLISSISLVNLLIISPWV